MLNPKDSLPWYCKVLQYLRLLWLLAVFLYPPQSTLALLGVTEVLEVILYFIQTMEVL